MKRRPKIADDLSDIYLHVAKLKWIPCEKCGNEFKGEEMWAVAVGPDERWGNMHRPGRTHSHYFCKECFPTRESMENYSKKMKTG